MVSFGTTSYSFLCFGLLPKGRHGSCDRESALTQLSRGNGDGEIQFWFDGEPQVTTFNATFNARQDTGQHSARNISPWISTVFKLATTRRLAIWRRTRVQNNNNSVPSCRCAAGTLMSFWSSFPCIIRCSHVNV